MTQYFSSPQAVQIVAEASFVVAILLLLPLVARDAMFRFVAATARFEFKLRQYLWPAEHIQTPSRILFAMLRIGSDGKGQLAQLQAIVDKRNLIRQLAGLSTEDHLRALEGVALFIAGMTSKRWVVPRKFTSHPILSSGEIFSSFVKVLRPDLKEELESEIHSVLTKDPLDLEQVVEVLLFVVDVLGLRIKGQAAER